MLGKYCDLNVVSIGNHEVLLSFKNSKKKEVAIRKDEFNEIPEINTPIRGFVYHFEKGLYQASLKKPFIELGEIAMLEVKDATKIGVFLDWGMDKDLYLPFKEQTFKPIKGMKYLFKMYEDTSGRLCATMRIKESLIPCDRYKENDWVNGVIYGINRNFGAFVVVDKKYDGLIKNENILGAITEGDTIKARVISVTENGKLNLSLRDRAYMVIGDDAERIYNKIIKNGGRLNITDSSPANQIKEVFGISKSSFKRAVGRLYKDNKIVLKKDHIKLIEDGDKDGRK